MAESVVGVRVKDVVPWRTRVDRGVSMLAVGIDASVQGKRLRSGGIVTGGELLVHVANLLSCLKTLGSDDIVLVEGNALLGILVSLSSKHIPLIDLNVWPNRDIGLRSNNIVLSDRNILMVRLRKERIVLIVNNVMLSVLGVL